MTVAPVLTDPLEGVDEEPGVVHVWIAGTKPKLSYCGIELDGKPWGWLPPEEVTEAAWCPDCVRIQDGLP